jgi:hypothetical protein
MQENGWVKLVDIAEAVNTETDNKTEDVLTELNEEILCFTMSSLSKK